jgi:hypothetical protein
MSDDLKTLTRDEMFRRLREAGWMDTEEDRDLAEREWRSIEKHQQNPQPYMDYIRFLSITYVGEGSALYRPTSKKRVHREEARRLRRERRRVAQEGRA